ncbi:MAG: hypothetical protein WCB32_07330, partial [Pseudolabrys sp.]
GKSHGRIHGTVVNLKELAHECTIVAMEHIDDAGLGGRNSFIFNAVDVYGRLAALASNPD